METVNLENFKSITNIEGASQRVSSRYAFVPTKRVLDVLADFGWHPSSAQQSRVMSEDKDGVQKHVVRLRNANFSQLIKSREYHPEIIVKNAHDLSSGFELSLGIWRQVCANGMCATEEYGRFVIRHIGFAEQKVSDATNQLIEFAPKLLSAVDRFQSIELSREEQLTFAQTAIELKHDPEDGTFKLDPVRVNDTRRYADQGNDLWRTFNRVQENIIKGGVRGTTDKNKRRVDRAVGAIDRSMKLNRALWSLTERMAAIKTGQTVFN